MSLINCPECIKVISNTASFCIHCGYRMKLRGSIFINASGFDAEVFRLLLILGLIAILVGVIIIFQNFMLGFAVVGLGIIFAFMGTTLLLIQSIR